MRAYDNGGRTADRYSVTMPDGDVLSMSSSPSHPQGVCTYLGEGTEPDGVEIPFEQLPQACRDQVAGELLSFYRDLTDRSNDAEADTDWMTCGTCGRTWNDAHGTELTPVPAGRCPFEYEHEGD